MDDPTVRDTLSKSIDMASDTLDSASSARIRGPIVVPANEYRTGTVIGTDTWTYYPTGSSAPVPDTKASYWDEQIPGDWRSAPVLVGPDDGKVYSGYQFE